MLWNKHFMAVNDICHALQAHISYFKLNRPKSNHCRLGNQGALTTQFTEWQSRKESEEVLHDLLKGTSI